jgi:hypothetical protein
MFNADCLNPLIEINFIPVANATEMAMYSGYFHTGWKGPRERGSSHSGKSRWTETRCNFPYRMDNVQVMSLGVVRSSSTAW